MQMDVSRDEKFTADSVQLLQADFLTKRRRAQHLKQEYELSRAEADQAKKCMDSALVRYAQAECLELAATMYRKLPAELRTCVYQYLCVEDQPIPVGPYYHTRKYNQSHREYERLLARRAAGVPVGEDYDLELDSRTVEQLDNYIILADGRVKYDHTEQPPSGTLLPYSHVFNRRYMGNEVGGEAERYYYANNTFSICTVTGAIYEFLRHNGSVPVPDEPRENRKTRNFRSSVWPFQLVRNLQIRIKHEHYTFHLGSFLKHPTPAEEYAAERNHLQSISSELQILEQLPQQARKLQIELVIMTALEDFEQEDQERRFVNLLETIRSIVYAMMHDQDAIIRITHHDPKVSAFPRDLTCLWSLTKEQWEQEKAANGGELTRSTGFYLAPEEMSVAELWGGFHDSDLQDLLAERWGITNVFEESKPRWPIRKGRYWPVGNAGLDD